MAGLGGRRGAAGGAQPLAGGEDRSLAVKSMGTVGVGGWLEPFCSRQPLMKRANSAGSQLKAAQLVPGLSEM